MADLRLEGVEVCTTVLGPRWFRAAAREFLLPVTPANRDDRLAEFQRVGEFGPYGGLKLDGISDLSFLQDFPDLLYLEVINQKRVDPRALEALGNLRGLRIETPGAGIDFAWFPELEYFVGDWHDDNRNLAQARELRRMQIWQFKPRTADLSELAQPPRLESLDVTQTNITSLGGVEQMEDLRYLDIAYAPQLKSLDALTAGNLELRELSIAKAKNIASYQPIAALRRLRRLKLSACAPMPNLQWTRGMDHLDMFTFVETNVEDGNLSPLLDLPKLINVGTMDKKHHNYKCNQLNDILAKRQNPAE